ncbi:MAG: cardiolipin synthase [Ferrovum sp.]|nr:cardiolipin synthase [Ferrovum sp.]
MIHDLPYPVLALEHSALVLGGLLIYFLLTKIGQQHRPPASAIAWVMAIGLFPYVGIPLFLLFGMRKFPRPLRRSNLLQASVAILEEPLWATRLLAAMDMPPACSNAEIIFHDDGVASKAALLALIDGASQQVAVCSFILAPDEVGLELVAALGRAAARGVKVRVLLDTVGGLQKSRRHIPVLRAAGVSVRWFMPLLHNPLKGRSNLRNHRKMAIADGVRLWSGGRNLAAEYFVGCPACPVWVDLSFEVRGPLAKQAQALFERDWKMPGGMGQIRGSEMTVTPWENGRRAQLIPSGPDLADDTVYDLLLTSAYQAKRRIVAVSPYFVPDEALLLAWCMACRRGVTFTLLLPQRSNHMLADLAREQALRELVHAGAEVMLYPGMIHAKALIIDEDLALCGSANLDGRSLFLNFELMTAFYGATEIDWLSTWVARHTARAKSYRPRVPSWRRDIVEGLARTIGFQL